MLDEKLFREIEAAAGKPGVREAPLRRFTSFGSGGAAAFMIEAGDSQQVAGILEAIEKHGAPWFILGKGSNLLVADEGFDGVVIYLSGELAECRVQENLLICGAGAILARAANLAAKNSLTGMESLAHIPGTLGGAVVMNAGAFGGQIGELVELVAACLPGECREMGRDALQFGYRSSNLDRGLVVTRIILALTKGDPEEIREKMLSWRARRTSTQPHGKRTFGSAFKNPPGGVSAGRLLDDSGCKSLKAGGAAISDIHANFIINNGNATAADVIALMNLCRWRVHDQFGIILEPEVRLLGDIGLEKLS